MELDHWEKNTLQFITPYFLNTKNTVKIATGFFSIQGYNLIRPSVEGKTVYILVGYDETQNERLREKLIDDIMTYLRRWDDLNRRQAVEDLVAKLERGELHIVEKGSSEFIEGRIRKDDHGKVYIFDDKIVCLGSPNLTVKGLRFNDESSGVITEPERVRTWVSYFEEKWNAPDTYDLTRLLLDALKDWLKLHPPYDVYLKTIQALIPKDEAINTRSTYKKPADFQEVIIERVLRQLRGHRGAMLVASTGLGKTIMATHSCYRLALENRINNIVVFAPIAVHPDWEEALDSAGLNHKLFTRQILDMNTRGPEQKRLAGILEKIDDRYIIILDESQYFRNEIRQQGGKRRSFTTLMQIVNSKKCLVLSLTATPLAKGVEDLNNQLLLLPHTAETNYVRPDGQIGMEGFVDFPKNAWQVQDTEDYFDRFMKLPVSTVVSTSWVAKNYGITTDEGDYVERPDGSGWLPRIDIRKIKVPVPFEKEMTQALDGGYFRHKLNRFKIRGQWQHSQSSIENEVSISWASSPLALQEVVNKTMTDQYKVEFVKGSGERKRVLGEISQKLFESIREYDSKFTALCETLQFHANEKVIIFTEREATAVYLEKMLNQAMPNLRIANVVRETASFEYELKSFEAEIYNMILDFAPEANKSKIVEPRRKSYDVFIFTDAYSMGVNLQDASVVINYDLAWTADILIQRAGRILRFWIQPRQVYIYIFIGIYLHNSSGQQASSKVEDRLNELTLRTRQAERFSELPIIPDKDHTEYKSFGALSNVTYEDLGNVDITQIEEFSGGSPFLSHITEFKQNSSYAESISDDISSAMLRGERHRIYLLLQHREKFHWTMYDIKSKKLIDMKEDALLNLIKCTRQMPIANVDANLIEQEAQLCKGLWCHKQEFAPDEVERICALYLKPESEADEIDSLFRQNTNHN